MTNLAIIDNDTVIQYTASAAQTVFPYDFPILDQGELKVSVDQVDQSIVTHYTVSGVGDAGGGDVTFGTPMTGGEIVTIWLDMPIKRLTGFSEGAATLLGTDLNREFVRQVRHDQMMRRDLRRAMRLAPDDPASGSDMELPPTASRVGKFLVFNASGLPTVSEGSGGGDTSLRSDLAESTLGSTNGISLVAVPITQEETDRSASVVNAHYFPYDPMRYGAAADGVTNDDLAFVEALKLPRIDLKGRPYLVSDLVTSNVVSIFGQGGTLKADASTLVNDILDLAHDRCRLHDVNFDGNKSAFSGAPTRGECLRVSSDFNRVADCAFDNTYDQTAGSAVHIENADHNRFTRCSSLNAGYAAYRVNGGSFNVFTDCVAVDFRIKGFLYNESGARLDLVRCYAQSDDANAEECFLIDPGTVGDPQLELLVMRDCVDNDMPNATIINTSKVANVTRAYLYGCAFLHAATDHTSTFRVQEDCGLVHLENCLIEKELNIDNALDELVIIGTRIGLGTLSAGEAIGGANAARILIRDSEIANYTTVGLDIEHATPEVIIDGCVFRRFLDDASAPMMYTSGSGAISSRNVRVTNTVAYNGLTGTADELESFLTNSATTRRLVARDGSGRLHHATAVPADGTWAKGDRVINSDPDLGEPAAWVCTTAGTPGTWGVVGQNGYRSGSGTPASSVTPFFLGERYFDTNAEDWYTATGSANTDWKQDSA